MNLLETLRNDGYTTVPDEYYTHIDTWESWYKGKVEGFHNYAIFNGVERLKMERYAMGMGKKVCEDWANLLMNEKVKITLEGKAEQDFFDEVCNANDFSVRCNEMQELKAAFGTVAYIPRVVGVKVNPDSGMIVGDAEGMKIDYVYGQNIIPLAWSNRKITECAFATKETEKDRVLVYVQIHKKNGNNYDIVSRLFDATNGQFNEIKLSDVDRYKSVPAVIHTGTDKPQFVIDRLTIVNSIDPTSPMGISVFANAIDQLKGCDIAYDSYVNEFVLGKKRIMVKPAAAKDIDGNPTFDPNDVAFYWLPEDSTDGNIINEVNMEIRSAQHNAGIQDMLNALSAKCGFGQQHYRFDQGSVATATQIVSQNSELFRTIKKHEIILESVLIDLARTILRLGNTYMGKSLDEDVEISVDFDDSIIEDEATDFQRDTAFLQMGIMDRVEFRMKWFNEDEATAKEALPKMETMVGDSE